MDLPTLFTLGDDDIRTLCNIFPFLADLQHGLALLFDTCQTIASQGHTKGGITARSHARAFDELYHALHGPVCVPGLISHNPCLNGPHGSIELGVGGVPRRNVVDISKGLRSEVARLDQLNSKSGRKEGKLFSQALDSSW